MWSTHVCTDTSFSKYISYISYHIYHSSQVCINYMLLLLQESKQRQFEPKTFLVNRWGGCGEINNFHKLWYCEKDFSGFSSATLYEYWNQEQCCKTMNRSWLIVTGSVNCSYMKMTVSWMLPVQERTWGHRKHLHLDLVFRLKIFKKKKLLDIYG